MHYDQIMESYTPLNDYLNNYIIKLHISYKHYPKLIDLYLKAILDEGPESRDQWIQTILLVKSF